MESVSCIFRAKTLEAYTIKTLSEVLQNILTDVCFEFTPKGIKLLTVDNKQPPHLLVNLNLQRDNFEEYNCKKNITLGINLQHLYKMLKSIKKKDSIILFIRSDQQNYLSICTRQSDSTEPTYSRIKIQKLQKLDTDIPGGYSKPHLIPTANFQKMCKDMNSISKIIRVESKGYYLCFHAEVEQMYERSVPFGQRSEDDEEDDEEYEDIFNTKSLAQLIKASGLNAKMHIYTRQGLPLKICINTGSLGTLEIYIKSCSQVDEKD